MWLRASGTKKSTAGHSVVLHHPGFLLASALRHCQMALIGTVDGSAATLCVRLGEDTRSLAVMPSHRNTRPLPPLPPYYPVGSMDRILSFLASRAESETAFISKNPSLRALIASSNLFTFGVQTMVNASLWRRSLPTKPDKWCRPHGARPEISRRFD